MVSPQAISRQFNAVERKKKLSAKKVEGIYCTLKYYNHLVKCIIPNLPLARKKPSTASVFSKQTPSGGWYVGW